MDALELLHTRASNGKLTEPGPDDATLTLAFEAAARAPDHGALRPWRIHVVRGAAREALGAVLAELEAARDGASAESIDKARHKPLRAPLLLAVSARVVPNPKVPAIEQILAAGALAHGLLLGLHAHGYAAIWRTGTAAYDDEVKRALGLTPEDALVGFLYIGTAAQPAPPIARPRAVDVIEEWPPR
jgi:nitroreductase